MSLSSAQFAQPSDCLAGSSTFEDLISCFDAFTVSFGAYTAETYAAAQPTPPERAAWIDVVGALMRVSRREFTCMDALNTLAPPNPLAGVYTVSEFVDGDTAQAFCVLHEAQTLLVNGTARYDKGWGLVAVPAHGAHLDVHFSAPHPQWDLNTPEQAAALFKGTRAKSLVIAGRIRNAYMVATDCIPSTTQTIWITDPAHDIEQPFFNATIVIYEEQMKRGGCPSESCAFLQMHGKASTTCPENQAFLSSGLGRGPLSLKWYTDRVPRPIKSLQKALQSSAAFPDWTISMPSDDSTCSLTATTNVFGRLVNGVPLKDVCRVSARPSATTGAFVHIEQSSGSRAADVYANWTTAILHTFRIPTRILEP
ncbi:hypothetical protein AURDEDRAFT_110677 [Auricularia subglabra TFB-10046 SS5]|nr:hypothetical protein AURDEDRAFT_110677 [Auricularia subglabra TFB-10046 SS5]